MEAVTNAIKYSEATEIAISTGTESDSVFLSVSDNGKGLIDNEKNGRGMTNMQRRAEKIGARLYIGTDDGVTLKLVL